MHPSELFSVVLLEKKSLKYIYLKTYCISPHLLTNDLPMLIRAITSMTRRKYAYVVARFIYRFDY